MCSRPAAPYALHEPSIFGSQANATFRPSSFSGMPALRPKYYTLESPNSEWPAWAISTWWIIDPAKR